MAAIRQQVPDGYDFWLYTADDTASEPQPIVIFLHGASLCGNNLERVRRYGPLHALQMGLEIPANIVAPQNPGGAWRPEKILHVLQWVEEHYPIDTNRVYVFGMSLGGYGTFDFAGTYPDKVAAAIAMCGGSQLRDFCGLNEVPLWIIHGTADRQVPISQSMRIIQAMERCGATKRMQFTRLQGAGHGAPARAFYLTTPYEWLLSHRMDTPLRPVTPGYDITSTDMRDAYSRLRKGAGRIRVKDEGTKPHPQTATTDKADVYYTVRKGDSLSRIAARKHTTVTALCRLNGLKRDSVIRPGQRLKVR
ncbi:MAG: phospholipase/carboxylesterase [bacterium P3]|nr:MAG: phospholipase/carboxylesterase [bacterium P3]KWW42111.1 MAG: phospholipase/carboxylesterase [bacterium F083]